MQPSSSHPVLALVVIAALVAVVPAASADLMLGAAELVSASGADIDVPGYSVPSFVEWNGDGLPDLIVGEGSGSFTAKVRVYLNEGTAFRPQFYSYSYVQSDGVDLELPGAGDWAHFRTLSTGTAIRGRTCSLGRPTANSGSTR